MFVYRYYQFFGNFSKIGLFQKGKQTTKKNDRGFSINKKLFLRFIKHKYPNSMNIIELDPWMG